MKYTGVEGVISSRWGGPYSSGVVNGFNTYQYWEIFNANIAYWLVLSLLSAPPLMTCKHSNSVFWLTIKCPSVVCVCHRFFFDTASDSLVRLQVEQGVYMCPGWGTWTPGAGGTEAGGIYCEWEGNGKYTFWDISNFQFGVDPSVFSPPIECAVSGSILDFPGNTYLRSWYNSWNWTYHKVSPGGHAHFKINNKTN